MPTPQHNTLYEFSVSLTDLDAEELAAANFTGIASVISNNRIIPQTKSIGALASIEHTAAYICFVERINEFIKNALDADAKELTISFEVVDDIVEVHIKDNGNAESLTDREPYDWQTALLTPSEKRDQEDMLGGRHLGLAMCAHFLEGNEGQLSLKKNLDSKGAHLTLTSSLAELKEKKMMEAGNYMAKMISDLIATFESLAKSPPVIEIDHIAPGQVDVFIKEVRLWELAEKMFPKLKKPDSKNEFDDPIDNLRALLNREYNAAHDISSRRASFATNAGGLFTNPLVLFSSDTPQHSRSASLDLLPPPDASTPRAPSPSTL